MPNFWDWLRAFWLLFLTSVWFFLAWKVIQVALLVDYLMNNTLILAGVLMFAAVIFPIICSTYMHYIFWGERNPKLPVWIATLPSWYEGAGEWFIASTASVICALILAIVVFVLVVIFGGAGQADPDKVKEALDPIGEKISIMLIILWLIIAALMQRWKRLIVKWWQKRKNSHAEEQEPKI